jgi:protein-L-isoaspartate(D-aspartate) O-methyltransferase
VPEAGNTGTQHTSERSTASAANLRGAMTDMLKAGGWITTAIAETAFRAVPRELFAHDSIPLETVYNPDTALRGKRGTDGALLSVVSAPRLQARMIAQARIRPGMSVLEVGSGGYNAALLAEITGPAGRVVSVDIDPDITALAVIGLRAAGYGDRVTVVTADAGGSLPGDSLYDAIVVTAGAWDVAPAWISRLAQAGALVVPLRMNGITRSVEFRRAGDHLTSASAEVCEFVPLQGVAAHAERSYPMPLPEGGRLILRFEDSLSGTLTLPDGILSSEPADAWTAVTIANMAALPDLFLWCAGFVPGFCKVTAENDTRGWMRLGNRLARFSCGCAEHDSFAFLTTRGLADDTIELGARGYGPHASDLAGRIATQITAWDRHGRDVPGDAFAYWPAGTRLHALPGKVAAFRKALGTVTITWPASREPLGETSC